MPKHITAAFAWWLFIYTSVVHYTFPIVLRSLVACSYRNYNFSTGKPTTGLISEAKERSSYISSSVSLQPSAPANSSACSAVLAPGIGTTFSWAISQLRATYSEEPNS